MKPRQAISLLGALTLSLFLAVGDCNGQRAPLSNELRNDQPRPSNLGLNQKAKVIECMIQELKFAMLMAPQPDGNPSDIKGWVTSTQERLVYLEGFARDIDETGRLSLSIERFKELVCMYEVLQKDLSMLDFVTEIRVLQGDKTWRSGAASMLNLLLDGAENVARGAGNVLAGQNPKVACAEAIIRTGFNALSDGLERWDEDFIFSSLVGKVKEGHKSKVKQLVEDYFMHFAACANAMDVHFKVLSERYSLLSHIAISGDHDERGNDLGPFKWVMSAYALSEDKPSLAGEHLFQAAGQLMSIKQDGYENYLKVYYRTPFLFMAANLFEFEARRNPLRAAELSEQSVSAFEEGLKLANGELSYATYPAVLAYSRALVRTNRMPAARKMLTYLEEKVSSRESDALMSASRYYDLACLRAQIGEHNVALNHLRHSFELKPRRDSFAMLDPELAQLVNHRRGDVQQIVDHPLVGGTWDLTSMKAEAKYFFCPGGDCRQVLNGRLHKGKWNAIDGKLSLTGRGTLGDATYTFEIFGEDALHLRLTLPEGQLVYQRKSRSALPGKLFDDRDLQEIGTWNWRTSRPLFFPRYCTVPDHHANNGGGAWRYWFMSEHPLTGITNSELLPAF